MFLPPEIYQKIRMAEKDAEKMKADLKEIKKELQEIKKMLNNCLKK